MKKKILILVKTYPNLSTKYEELVCTAGIDEQGQWYRLYPIPFRKLDTYKKYHKYEWVDVDIERNYSDPRPESFKIINNYIKPIDDSRISTKNEWSERRIEVLNHQTIYEDLAEIIALAHDNKLSFVTFKPKQILDLIVEENWDQMKYDDKRQKIQESKRQLELFSDENAKNFQPIPMLPYKFSYKFKDINGKTSTLQIQDWEIGELYWNCFKKAKGDTRITISKVKEQYQDNFITNKDLYFFLGTMHRQHVFKSRNPFIITGVFYPPKLTTPSNPTLF